MSFWKVRLHVAIVTQSGVPCAIGTYLSQYIDTDQTLTPLVRWSCKDTDIERFLIDRGGVDFDRHHPITTACYPDELAHRMFGRIQREWLSFHPVFAMQLQGDTQSLLPKDICLPAGSNDWPDIFRDILSVCQWVELITISQLHILQGSDELKNPSPPTE